MKRIRRLTPSKRISLLVIFGCVLLISGCASVPGGTCAQFEERIKELEYATQYRNVDTDFDPTTHHFKLLPRNTSAVVPLYKLQLDADTISPCNHLAIHKELYLQRSAKGGAEFEEIREFYSGDGTLIASKRETVSKQLNVSGYYVATVPLPIPKLAPMGKYLIVSKLVVRTTKNRQGTVLAKASVGFQVVPRDGCAPPT
jgi:hypothetical protein